MSAERMPIHTTRALGGIHIVSYYYNAYSLTPHQGRGLRWLVAVHPRWADRTSTGTVDAKSGEVL